MIRPFIGIGFFFFFLEVKIAALNSSTQGTQVSEISAMSCFYSSWLNETWHSFSLSAFEHSQYFFPTEYLVLPVWCLLTLLYV